MAGDDTYALWPQHCHKSIEAHEHDELDGGIHVGQAQVKEDLTHHIPKHPRLHNQVDDEEWSESHQRAISYSQVEDEEGGDRLLSGVGQDAPDDKDVSREAQKKNEAQDESPHTGGNGVCHNGLISCSEGCGVV